jgi:hypothetical protein
MRTMLPTASMVIPITFRILPAAIRFLGIILATKVTTRGILDHPRQDLHPNLLFLVVVVVVVVVKSCKDLESTYISIELNKLNLLSRLLQ